MATQEQERYLRSLERGRARPSRRIIPRLRPNGGGGLTVTATVAAGQSSPVNAGPINFTVTFSEAATGFISADVSTAGSTVGGTLTPTVTGGPTVFNVAVAGMSGNGNVTILIPAGSATNSKGQSFPASNATSVTFDTTRPSVTIDQAAGQADPVTVGPIAFTAVFSEPVSGFVPADISFTGSTAGGTLAATITGGPATYNVAVSGMTTSGNVVVSIPANAATDLAGNLSLASTSTDNTVNWALDTTPPSVTINQAAGQNDPTNASPIVFTVVFSEPVLGFTGSDISFTGSTVGGTLAAAISGTGPTYTVNVTGMTTSGTVVASIPAGVVTDLSSNANLASTSTDNSVTWDPVAPAVTINQAAGQADPATGSPILFTVVFTEAVVGFTAADVDLSASTMTGLSAAISGTGPTYTVSVTGMATPSAIVRANIPAGVVTDLAGNPNTASTSTDNSVTWTGPGVTGLKAPLGMGLLLN